MASSQPVVVCMPDRSVTSRGVWLGDNPLTFSTPVFMLQIAFSSFFTNLFNFLLKPFGVGSFFSHMVGAIIVGPKFFGKLTLIPEYVFSWESLYVFETFQNFGTVFFLFLVGIKMNLSMVTTLGRKAWIIGISAFLAPLLIVFPLSLIINKVLTKASLSTTHINYGKMLPVVAMLESASSFHVVISFLADLKLLNSEIGHLAMSSSLISNALSWSSVLLLSLNSPLMVEWGMIRIATFLCMIIVVSFLMKPAMSWMVKKTPEGITSLKEIHVFFIFLMVLACAFLGQAAGQSAVLGPMLLGLVVPSGPPLETTIEEKLESIVSCILMPSYYVSTMGSAKPLSFITSTGFILVELIVVLAFIAKLFATLFSALYYDMRLRDAFTLGLIISSQGFVDLLHFRGALVYEVVNAEVFSVMTYSSMALAGITTLLVKLIYQPSQDYMHSKRNLQNLTDFEFCILVCVYRETNVPTIIDILEASYPNRDNPISVYLLHLIELQRVARPILIAHKTRRKGKDEKNMRIGRLDEDADVDSIHFNRSKHIINAFKFFKENKHGTVCLNSFTTMSPYDTMHEDICALAVDKRISLIIVPFHRQLNIDGLMEPINSIRNVNLNILKKSPCSVGILIDRGGTNATTNCIIGNQSLYRVAIVFLGGVDDREVLTFGMRMGERPNTTLTVIRFLTSSDEEEEEEEDIEEKYLNLNNIAKTSSKGKNLDEELIHKFRVKFNENERVIYREQVVRDGVAMLKAIKKMDYNSYDLIMVGRQHRKESILVRGLEEWNEFAELGFLGDMLATCESQHNVSVLVVQQQFYISDGSHHNQNSYKYKVDL